MTALSPLELELLRRWRADEDAHGEPPTRKAVAAALGVSVARVKDLLQGLCDKGELDEEDVGPIGPAGRGASHGLSPREQQIMDLFDAGRSAEEIHRELRIDLGYVRTTIRNFDFAQCWSNSVKFERGVRAGDARYQAALAAAGGSYR